MISIFNTAQELQKNKFRWAVVVREANEHNQQISSVTFQLHPTFKPSRVTVSSPPWQIERTGWGTFDIGVDVKFKNGSVNSFTHELSFEERSPVKQYRAPVRSAPVSSSPIQETKRKMPGKTPEKKKALVITDPQLQKQLQVLDRALAEESKWRGKSMTGVSRVGMHGRCGDTSWAAPRLLVECDEDARPGYNTMKAHEYADQPSVLFAKVKVLAQLIRKSKHFTAYTGAGISTASGIDDYASKSKNSVAMKRKKVSGFDAQPTLAHRVMGAVYRAGYLKHWVQQNHDGLPQKAGFPPEHLNEIHGAWYDPSNPVVPMSGTLRDDLYAWMEEWEEKSDLTIAMGTSLCGMNADRMVETPEDKVEAGDPDCLGSIVVGLQRTAHDEKCSLRFFCKCDEVMALLARELGLLSGNTGVRAQGTYQPTLPPNSILHKTKFVPDVFKVPYDRSGKLCADESKHVNWDLRQGANVMVTMGPGTGYVGTVEGRTKEGHVRVRLPCQREGSKQQGKVWRVYVLGQWWFETAVNGKASQLPVVNTSKSAVLPKAAC